MKGGIVAAGDGTRLQGSGGTILKPLLEVGGQPLIDHALDRLIEAGAESIALIVNDASRAVRDHVLAREQRVPVHVVVQSTPSSLHSLLVLRPFFGDEDALVSTVDSIMPPGSAAALVHDARARRDSDGTLGITDFVEDERPLCVQIDGRRITALGTNLPGAEWITAGIYYFTARIWPELERAEAQGLSRLRGFLGHLLATGYRLHGYPLPKTVDVDRPEDVEAAEAYVTTWEHTT